MVYGGNSVNRQRPTIATAVQRASSSTTNHRAQSLHRYCYRILAVVLSIAAYTVFLYSSGTSRSLVCITLFNSSPKLLIETPKTTFRNSFRSNLINYVFIMIHSNTSFLFLQSTNISTINTIKGGARSYFGDSTIESVVNNNNQNGKKPAMKTLVSRRLQISTWNIAAINNNPFEYWITAKDNPHYDKLMLDVENFIINPGDNDVPVSDVFTQGMFDQLDKRLTETAGWKSVRSYWDDDFSKRKIVAGFMKDGQIGKKRLASMPDRVTNTINLADGTMAFRPTVINMYEDDLGSADKWWKAWESFMFEKTIKLLNKNNEIEERIPYQMLEVIKHAKYPELTKQEEVDSLPLQTLCGAIFDAILVHMMNSVAEPDVWQPLKKSMVENLNKKKVPHTLEILEKEYSESDIITLQEVSAAFIDMARESPVLNQKFHIISPKDINTVRDQNSVICLNKATFPSDQYTEITQFVEAQFGDKLPPIASGDILAITTKTATGEPLVIASFHGDTDGLATIPVTDAIVKAMKNSTVPTITESHTLIFGLDANTYENAIPKKQQNVMEYGKSFAENGLTSCWGDVPNPSNYTTYNARTYLQPQLNKACKHNEKRSKGDVNPKDFILFPKNTFNVISTWKDNTGKKQYTEDMAFPTLEFPSDHGILSTIIEWKE
jgi:hypothetical protein